MPISEEAVKALELMPVGLLDHEKEQEKEHQKLETIKHTTSSMRKLSYAAYYINVSSKSYYSSGT